MENKHPLLLWEEVSTTRRNMEYLQKIAKIYEDLKKIFFCKFCINELLLVLH